MFTQAILSGIDGGAVYRGNGLPFFDLRRYFDLAVPHLNRDIVNDLFRGLKVDQRERPKDASAGGNADIVQKPVAVVPKGMESFVIIRRR